MSLELEYIYVVMLEGIHRHEIKGVEIDESRSIDLAIKVIKSEKDYYHRVIVLKVPLGVKVDDGEVILRLDMSESGITRIPPKGVIIK